MSSMFYVTVEGRLFSSDAIRGVLSGYGDLVDFSCIESAENQVSLVAL